MDMFFLIMLVIIIISLILFWYISTFNKYQRLIIRINEVEANIDAVLRKRFDLLNKSINIIRANASVEGEVLELIVKLRSRKISNFDLDRQLYEAINEFNYYKDTYKELSECESIIKIDASLNESEFEIIALRKYYNDTITDYNKMIKHFPSNFVARVSKYKEKTYYDGKNMNDDIINDFKL